MAYRWLKAGYSVVIGSRTLEKAQMAVENLSELLPGEAKSNISGDFNNNAIKKADIIVLTIPFQFHAKMLKRIKPLVQNKIVLDVTVPLVPPKVTTVHVPDSGSSAKETQEILGEKVKVISAFQNVSFEILLEDKPIECDVLVCGTDKNTREIGVKLVEDAGLIGWDAGPLENSIVAEGLTSILIRINKKFKIRSAGIKITGVPK